MNIILISGIVLVAAAVGLLGFVLMQQKKTTKKDAAPDGQDEKKSSLQTSRNSPAEKDEDDKATAATVPTGTMNIATKSFFILCTLTFWVLFASASYWAYVAQPLYGLIIACSAILVYAILVVLQEVLKNLISLNRRLLPPEDKE